MHADRANVVHWCLVQALTRWGGALLELAHFRQGSEAYELIQQVDALPCEVVCRMHLIWLQAWLILPWVHDGSPGGREVQDGAAH